MLGKLGFPTGTGQIGNLTTESRMYYTEFSSARWAAESRNRLALPERRDFFPAAKLQEGRLFRASERQI